MRDLQLDAEQVQRRGRHEEPRHRGRRTALAQRRFAGRARRRSRPCGSCGRCRARSRRCPADRDRRSAPSRRSRPSAVPRLIAVVVLPTPPFWLASTKQRGEARSRLRSGDSARVRSVMARRLDGGDAEDPGLGISLAREDLRLNFHDCGPRSIPSPRLGPWGTARLCPLSTGVRSSRRSWATARGRGRETTSTGPANRGMTVSIRASWIVAGAPVNRATWRRKAHLRELLSTRSTQAPVCPAMASTRPGNPAPEPRSSQVLPPAQRRGTGANRRYAGSRRPSGYPGRQGF